MYRGLSKLQFLIKKDTFLCRFFLPFLVIKTLDPDSLEMLDPYPDLIIRIHDTEYNWSNFSR